MLRIYTTVAQPVQQPHAQVRFVVSFLDASFNNLLQEHRAEWDAVKRRTECSLRTIFEDSSLQIVSVDPGSINFQLRTDNILGCFAKLIERQLQVPNPLGGPPAKVCIEYQSRNVSEVSALQDIVKHLEAASFPPPALTPDEVCRRVAALAEIPEPEDSVMGLSLHEIADMDYANDPHHSDSD